MSEDILVYRLLKSANLPEEQEQLEGPILELCWVQLSHPI